MTTYRVEKDGVTFYVQPTQLQYYADNGYRIYKTVEEVVDNVAVEVAAALKTVTGSSEAGKGANNG